MCPLPPAIIEEIEKEKNKDTRVPLQLPLPQEFEVVPQEDDKVVIIPLVPDKETKSTIIEIHY